MDSSFNNGKTASLLFFLLAAFLTVSTLFIILKDNNFPDQLRNFTASVYSPDECINECGSYGQTICEGNYGKKLCGNFDSDICLEWSQVQSCFNDLSCGYGDCSYTERPDWQCQNGECVYSCQNSESNCSPNSPQCQDSCSSLGDLKCGYIDPIFQKRQACGGNVFTGCKQWFDLNICQGSVECGYEKCKDNQMPVWKCANDICDYDCQDNITCCQDECNQAGATDCYDANTRQICGQNDQDPCLEWKQETCSGNVSCGYGNCIDSQIPVWKCANGNCAYDCQNDSSCCQSECFQLDETKCQSDSARQICGNFDTDVCLEWSSSQSCSENKPVSCGYGICQDTQKPVWKCSNNNCDYNCQNDSSCSASGTTCTDDCPTIGQGQCADSTNKKTCGYFDKDPCLDWSSSSLCSGPVSCGYGKCQNNEKPQWVCKDGKCDFNCVQDSNCGAVIPSSGCQNECSAKDQKKCVDDSNFQNCDTNFDSDSCLEWGPSTTCKCQGDSSCGAQGCSVNQRPVCRCQSNGTCSFSCQQDENCDSALWIPEAVCGDSICDSGEDVSCIGDCQGKKVEVIILAKKIKDAEWKNTLSVNPKDKINVNITVKNIGDSDFSNIFARAEIPKEFLYEKELKIGEEASNNDIRQGVDFGFFPAKSEKVVTFIISASSKIKAKTETKIEGIAEAESEKISNAASITIEKPSSGAKWYVWVIAILIAGAVFIGFMFLRARATV